MKNKLIFRILGALASALIIVSVFIPFISVSGYSTSLWETFEKTNSLYLPIMIIVFGAIGVIFFSLNVKTELAYMSTGAIIFFLVMRTIDILNQNAFNTLSVGYYCLAIGAIITGLMAFLNSLKTKIKEENIQVTENLEPTMLDQIDKLYNDQTTQADEINMIQSVNPVIQPIPVQPLETITPIQSLDSQQIAPSDSININQTQPNIEETVKIENVLTNDPVVSQNNIQPQIQQQPETIQPAPINPVIQEFSSSTSVNPVVQEFSTEQVSHTIPVMQQNPVVQEFSNQNAQVVSQPIVEPQPNTNNVPLNNIAGETQVNPVINEFSNPTQIQTESSNSNLDIFG